MSEHAEVSEPTDVAIGHWPSGERLLGQRGTERLSEVQFDAGTREQARSGPEVSMRTRLKELRWSETALGKPASWPQPLRAVLDIVLDSTHPMFLASGPERTWIHNDAFIPMGRKHPALLGRPSREVWSEAWNELRPMFDRLFEGEDVNMFGFTLALDQIGTIEDANFDPHTHVQL